MLVLPLICPPIYMCLQMTTTTIIIITIIMKIITIKGFQWCWLDNNTWWYVTAVKYKQVVARFLFHPCYSLRVSRWFAAWPRISARCGSRRAGSVGVLDCGGGTRGRLGARAELLVTRRLAHRWLADGWTEASRFPSRTGEPVAWLGQDLLLLPAVVTHPDHLGREGEITVAAIRHVAGWFAHKLA